jgi:GT2 family glycosyltransferase
MNKISIVILNWNGLEYMKMFLANVIRYSLFENTSVYVADNGSTDDSIRWISENNKEAKIIKLDKNYGFAGGYNRALSQLDSRYFVLLNSDVEVTENWLQPLVNYMDINPDVASCQPKILSYHNRNCFEYAGAAGGFIDKYGYPFCRGRIFNVTEKDYGQYNTLSDIFWSSGACMIVRSDAWNRFGGFDDSFFAHMEEIDLCWRFQNSGLRVCCLPDSIVYHVGGGALQYDSPFKTFLNFRNGLFLLYKNLPDNKLNSVLSIRKLLDGLAALVFLFKGQPGNIKAIMRAHISYYKNKSRLKVKRRANKKMQIKQSTTYILNKSIVFQFYIKQNKTYSSLKSGL